MTNEQLKKSMLSEVPVVWRGIRGTVPEEIECTRISAITYRLNKQGKIFVQAELLAKCGGSVITASPDNVFLKEGA